MVFLTAYRPSKPLKKWNQTILISLTTQTADGYYLCYIMIKFIFYGLVIYLVYKLVFELLIPVSKASAQMREKIQEMQQKQQNFQQQPSKPFEEPIKASKPSTDKDYIEFEEVKP